MADRDDDEDEQYQKDLTTAIYVFAHYLGIDLDKEQELIHIAEDAFENLPSDWEFGIGEGEHAGIPYFYNSKTNESKWNHPEEQKYKNMVTKERAALKEKLAKGGKFGKNDRREDRNDRRDDRRDTGRGRNTRDEVEMTEVEEVEDFDDQLSTPRKPAGNNNGNNTRRDDRNDRGGGGNKVNNNNNRPGFGMSEEDFLDNGPEEYDYNQRKSNDRDVSPPLFRNQKQGDGNGRTQQVNLNTTTASSAISNPAPANRVFRKGAEGMAATNTGTATLQAIDFSSSPSPRSSSPTDRLVSGFDKNNNGGAARDQSRGRDRDDRGNMDRGRGGGRNDGFDRGDRGGDTSRDASRRRGGLDDRDRRDNRDTRDARDTRDNRDTRDPRDNRGRGSPTFRAERRGDGRGEGRLGFIDAPDPVDVDAMEELRRKKEEALDQLGLLKTQHQHDILRHKEEVRSLEEKLHEERRQRKQLEETLAFQEAQKLSKEKELEDIFELKTREHARKIRSELEEEMKDKVRSVERHTGNELDNVRLEMQTVKRKNEELERENDTLKRKIFLSKEDGKAELNIEMNNLRQSVRELEDEDRRKSSDLRAMREENAALQGKLAMALQTMQATTIELENAKIQRQQAAKEVEMQLQNSLTHQQRIQRLEQDLAGSKAEVMVVKKEKESIELELRKLQSVATVSGDQLSATESEARRLKTKSQMEITRLTSKVTELDALVIVLKEQLDKASDSEHQAVRKVMGQLEAAEIENRRYKERLSDLTMKEEELNLKVRTLEKEIFAYQEMVYKKDKAIKEEQLNQEKYKESIEGIRKNYENQLAVLHDTYRKELAQKEQSIAQNVEEMNKLQQEVSERVPKIVQAALEKAEVQWQTHNQQQVVDIKHDYEAQIAKLKTEVHNMQTYYTEKEAKQKLATTDERIELDRLRQTQRQLQRDRDDLEDDCSKLKKQNRQYEHQVQSLELSVQDLQGKLQQILNRQSGNYSLVPVMSSPAVTTSAPKGLFNSLLQQSMEKNPPNGPQTAQAAVYQPMPTSMMDMSVNQSLYAQDVSNMINQDALAYLNQQLAQMKVQVQESLQPQSAGGYRKGVSFTPESLYPTPAYSRPPPRAVQELMKEELDTVPTKSGEGRQDRDDGADQAALWQRAGVSQAHNSTMVLDKDTSLLSQIPDYEAKETDRSAYGYPPRPSGRSTGAMAARLRYEAGLGQNSVNDSYLDMESFIDPVSSVNTSHVYESSSLHIIPDGGYYEGYWKAKYSRSK